MRGLSSPQDPETTEANKPGDRLFPACIEVELCMVVSCARDHATEGEGGGGQRLAS